MSLPERLSRDQSTQRDLYFLDITTPDELPDPLRLSAKHFVCFVAWFSNGIEAQTVHRLAEALLRAGCAYFCAWGIGCERVHDLFDEVSFAMYPEPEESIVMSTWHDEQSLDDALWYFLNNTWPDDPYFETCRAALAISIGGEREWEERIKYALRDPRRFSKEVLDAEEDKDAESAWS